MEKIQEVAINGKPHYFDGEPGVLTYDEISNLAGINPETNPVITCLSPGRKPFCLMKPGDIGPRENGADYHVADKTIASKNKMDCPTCKKETEYRHAHDTAYGLSGTHMAGSERYECKECGYVMFKDEGVKQGLQFILD